MNRRFRRALWRGGVMILAGVAAGFAANDLRRDSLPWRGDWNEALVAARHLAGLREISLEEARRLQLEGRALFLDARGPGEFARGHLPGAINVPPGEVEGYAQEIRAMAESGMIPISYCDGMDCPLSPELARSLQRLGVESVGVLVNGWSRWRQAGYPVEGDAP